MKYEQIADLLNGIAERFDWEKIMEGDYIIGLKQVNCFYLFVLWHLKLRLYCCLTSIIWIVILESYFGASASASAASNFVFQMSRNYQELRKFSFGPVHFCKRE